MIRTCFLLLFFIQSSGSIFAQKLPSADNLGHTIITYWALQQQLVLNEQPGKTLRLGIVDDLGNYVVYSYTKLNDSIYREKVEESNIEMSSDQLYIKRGRTLEACFPLNNRYTDIDFSAFKDSAGYLVRERVVTKGGQSFSERDVVRLDENYRMAEWWTYTSGKDSASYYRNVDLGGNCNERYSCYLTATDSIKHSYRKSCWGDGAAVLLDEKVFVYSLEMNDKLKLRSNEWIVPYGTKRSFNLVDFASEPVMTRGKLEKEDEVKIRTDKNGFITRIATTHPYAPQMNTIVGLSWRE